MRDGQRDFDFHLGSWTTRLSRLLRPLTGSDEWGEYEGTTVVRPVWGGLANLVELDVTGGSGRLQVLSLRLYSPETREWSLNSASSRSGVLSVPAIGAFKDGRGEFLNAESLDGRPIVSRFAIFEITRSSCRFEQAFSADGGKTWELNWVATDTRASESGR